MAVTPHGERCFVAVSFDASLAKVLKDARRWSEDPHREPAEVMLFACAEGPTEAKLESWRARIKDEFGTVSMAGERQSDCFTLMAATEVGAREVEDLIGRAEHGVFG